MTEGVAQQSADAPVGVSQASDPTTPVATVSVRTLCQFTARTGDLDRRLRPSVSAHEGREVHRIVALRPEPGLRYEVTVDALIDGLRVRGRADAIGQTPALVEEVKSHRGELDDMSEAQRALHWAQAETYAALYFIFTAEHQLPDDNSLIELRLRYVNVDTGVHTLLNRTETVSVVRSRLLSRAQSFSRWSAQQRKHIEASRAALDGCLFPMSYRPAQRSLAGAIYRAARDGGTLMAEAPTGLGKSLAAAFGALKALAGGELDKIFMLTCRTTGARSLSEALTQAAPAKTIRILDLGSQQRDCLRPGAQCTGASCDLASGFYDRLAGARDQAISTGLSGREALHSVAREHSICPYHLAHEMVAWADVVIADVNHYFDMNAGLFAQMTARKWRATVIVDEAHGLIERVRSMFSADLTASTLKRLTGIGANAAASVGLRDLHNTLRRTSASRFDQPEPFDDAISLMLASDLDRASSEVSEQLSRAQNWEPEALNAAFSVLRFANLWRIAGPDFQVEAAQDDEGLTLRCVIPSVSAGERIRAAQGAILMSATLSPFAHHSRLLGLDENVATFACPSPYAGQLRVHIHANVSTRFDQRNASVPKIVAVIARVLDQAPGNYLFYTSSYVYLDQICDALRREHPELTAWSEERGMSREEKMQFLTKFKSSAGGKSRLGFAVLGGAFNESIEFPADLTDASTGRLRGVFIATLGMPQFNVSNEAARRLIETRLGHGWAATYQYPGISKVIQAGGRVVRGPKDRGDVHLIDARYAERQTRALLPQWWQVDSSE